MKLREVNFIPSSIYEEKKKKARRRQSILLVLFIILIGVLLNCALLLYLDYLKDEIQKVDTGDMQVKELISAESIKSTEYNSTIGEMKQFKNLLNYSYKTKALIDDINKSVPSNIVLTGLYFQRKLDSNVNKIQQNIVQQTTEQNDNDTTNNAIKSAKDAVEEVEALDVPRSRKKKTDDIYEKIPNILVLEGESTDTSTIGIFTDRLSNTLKNNVSNIGVHEISKNNKNSAIEFTIQATIESW